MNIQRAVGKKIMLGAGAVIVVAGASYGGLAVFDLYIQNRLLERYISELERVLTSTKEILAHTRTDRDALTETLRGEQEKTTLFQSQLQDIAGTVGQLQKLKTIDPELLKKYSKVYFLSENYIPAKLTLIDSQYLYDKSKPQQILSPVAPFLGALLSAAAQDGNPLEIVSGYRSFQEQVHVKNGYTMTYGAGTANQFSADQGYSEHQLGTTVDFTTLEAGRAFSKFEKTSGYEWLTLHAYQFGFILSYPKNNSYYISEPWHWRFVGVALATKLYNDHVFFYDLSQREIDQYLISLYD